MKALIIRSPWIDLILSGNKTWEMRSRNCSYRGPIALIAGGTGKVVGTAELVDCLPKLDADQMRAHHAEHAIPEDRMDEVIADGWVQPWVLGNVQRLPQPVPYQHPNGAVTWVNLPPDWCAAPNPAVNESAEVKVRGQWADITVSGGNIRCDHLYLRKAWSLLPSASIGGGNKTLLGEPLVLHLDGIGAVETDIDGVKKMFRCRGDVGRFYAKAGVTDGDVVRLTRISDRVFHLVKVG